MDTQRLDPDAVRDALPSRSRARPAAYAARLSARVRELTGRPPRQPGGSRRVPAKSTPAARSGRFGRGR